MHLEHLNQFNNLKPSSHENMHFNSLKWPIKYPFRLLTWPDTRILPWGRKVYSGNKKVWIIRMILTVWWAGKHTITSNFYKKEAKGMRFLLSFTIWRIRIFLINFIIRIQTYYDCITHFDTKDWLPKWPSTKRPSTNMIVHQHGRPLKWPSIKMTVIAQIWDFKSRNIMTKMTVWLMKLMKNGLICDELRSLLYHIDYMI